MRKQSAADVVLVVPPELRSSCAVADHEDEVPPLGVAMFRLGHPLRARYRPRPQESNSCVRTTRQREKSDRGSPSEKHSS
jgi:hypothetical protein